MSLLCWGHLKAHRLPNVIMSTDLSGCFTRRTLQSMHTAYEEGKAIQALATDITNSVVRMASSSSERIFTREVWPAAVCSSPSFRSGLHAKLRSLFPDSSVYFSDWTSGPSGPQGSSGPTGCYGPRLIIDWSAPL